MPHPFDVVSLIQGWWRRVGEATHTFVRREIFVTTLAGRAPSVEIHREEHEWTRSKFRERKSKR